MRVLHLVPALFSGDGGILGGAERYALELARHMAEEVPVRLVTFGPADRQVEMGPLQVRVIGDPWYVRGQRGNPLSARVAGEIARADVVHCHQTRVLLSSLTALLGRLRGTPVFTSDLGGGGWDLSAYLRTDPWFRGHLHISEYSRRISGHQDDPASVVILGGVDTQRFHPPHAARERRSVVYVGRLLPHKGVDYLIESLPPGMRLELIGQPYDAEYLALLQRLAAGKDVRFRHDCSDDDLVRAYQDALCVVLPSVYRTRLGGYSRVPELLGQTLLEGMACGAAALCTDVASMPEVVVHGETGFVVPPNDAAALGERLAWLRDNPAAAADLGRRAREHVLQRFQWSHVVARCLHAYRSLGGHAAVPAADRPNPSAEPSGRRGAA